MHKPTDACSIKTGFIVIKISQNRVKY
jgi:hypothetical protein